MYSFARKPIWLAGHALAGGLLVICVIAGFWQLSRHAEVRDRNAAILERQEMQPLDVDRFFEAAADSQLLAELEYRTVNLPVERFDWNETVLIRNRSLDGLPGCHIAVPAATTSNDSAESSGVLLVAGWLPQQTCEPQSSSEARVWATRLTEPSQVTGRVRLSQERGWLGPSDPDQGRLESLARTDVERIDQQTTLRLVHMYVEVVSATREDGVRLALGRTLANGTPAPVPLPPPELDAGPHLGYTIQWFSFAAIAVVGYTLVLRHQARKGESERIADD